VIVVIPSNRAINLRYLTPLIDTGARFIIVDDSEGSIRVDHPAFEVYHWGHRKQILGKLDDGFPRKNGACRDFGLYMAWKHSDPGEIVVALDDDCEVYHGDFTAQVTAMLSPAPRPVATSSGLHLNILSLYDGIPRDLFPRGFPYSARGEYAVSIGAPESRNVTFSLGLWKGIFDVNAIDKIQGPAFEHPDARLRVPSVLIEQGKLVSVCSMNMQLRREVIPAVYQLPMHLPALPHWPIDRYGDIWGGFILKTLMDRKGEAMAVGEPMINHVKEGDPRRNVWQEHVCHLVNDEFIALCVAAGAEIPLGSYLDMMSAMAGRLRCRVAGASPLLRGYLAVLCDSMELWVEALS